MAQDIKQYFSVIKETGEGWRSNCPRCGDTEMKLYWNTEKGVGCCFHSSCDWFKDRGGVTEYVLRAFLTKEGIEIAIPELVKAAPETELKLPESFKTLDNLPDRYADPIYDYLDFRGLRKKIVDRARVGYCKEGPLWGYIIFPVFNLDGRMVWWQGRRFKKRDRKFFNPPSSSKTDYVYQIRGEPNPKYVIVVESIMNVLTLESGCGTDYDTTVIGTFGKGISDFQRSRILVYENSIKELWLALDPDALREAVSLADYVGEKAKVRIAKFPEGEDVNSLGFSKSWKLMRKAHVYDRRNRTQFLVEES